MLNALEEDLDERTRWRRLGSGALVAGVAVGALTYVANTYTPARELVERVVTITFRAPPPVPEEEKPPPPLPPPPPPKPTKPDPKPNTQNIPQSPKREAAPQPISPTDVGMDSQSFAEGGSGPGFRVGGNQMGDPNAGGAQPVPPSPAAPRPPARPTRYLMAKPLDKAANVDALYNQRARKLGLSGLMLIELALDEQGRVRWSKIRKGLEAQFDREVLAAIRQWMFEAPRKVAPDQQIASVRLLRLRFDLAIE